MNNINYSNNQGNLSSSQRKAAMTSSTQSQINQAVKTRSSTVVTPTRDLCADMQIRALGRWNELQSDRVVTRQNGYASYSLLKSVMNRSIMGYN